MLADRGGAKLMGTAEKWGRVGWVGVEKCCHTCPALLCTFGSRKDNFDKPAQAPLALLDR